jgi:hypothetical protein
MRKGILLIWIGMIFGQISMLAQKQEVMINQKVTAVVEHFIAKNAPGISLSVAQVEEHKLKSRELFYVVHLKPEGFVVVSPSSANPVLAFSFKNDLGNSPEELSFSDALFQDISRQKPFSGRTKEARAQKTWGPFVYTMWGQVNCYDQNNYLINVTNYYTPNNYAPGCVSISLSTLLHYYRWPIVGTRSYTYTDSKGSSTGTYTADFKNTYYQWDNMLDRYRYKRSSEKQRQAVGELVFQAAVSLTTDFEPDGSTSNVNRIPASGRNNFRFDGVERTPSSHAFWSMMDFNLSHRIPVVLAIKNNHGGGHSVVCDGLKIDEDDVYWYHLNMGWWGSSNGWYRIRGSWSVQGYNTVTDGIFYFLPIPQLAVPYIKNGASYANIAWWYPEKVQAQAFELQQKIGDGSWRTVSDTIRDTSFRVSVQGGVSQYFRVRAKVADRWPSNDWSNSEKITIDITGIPRNNSLGKISLSPNPVTTTLNLHFEGFIPARLAIYDIYGRRVLQLDHVPAVSHFSLKVGLLQKGFYILRLADQENHSKTLKFFKQ